MSYTVRLKPTDHQFDCEAGESILEAALRSGINLSYHCATGSCGECKARVVAGDVAEYRFHDYVIPEAEKLNNMVLLCSVSARSDLVVEANEAASANDVPLQRISVKVAKLEQPNANNAVLYLRTPRSQTLRFLAGQSIKITGAAQDPYFGYIASCPCNGMIIQIHVQRNRQPFANYVFNDLKTGDNLEIEGPYGEFTLDEASRRPVVMVAQDIGFAPMKSLIEHAIALDIPQSMQLFWLVEQGKDHYQANYCRSWEDALDSFIYRPLHLDQLENGHNDYQSACSYVLGRTPVETEIDLYLSGPDDMIAAFTNAFLEKGTPLSRIHTAKPL
jgi:CDP-4-dehydro-6-deoxyglucose reductase